MQSVSSPQPGERRGRANRAAIVALAALLCPVTVSLSAAQQTASVALRGHPQTLRLIGPQGGEPVIVASGDGGWMHLAPHVAEVLASRGFFIVGFDARAYLSSFTSARTTLRVEDEPGDFQTLALFAAGSSGRKPILIGVSEGAGLSVLAATDPATQRLIAGVVGLGLPDLNELGWRWRDAVIYLTHGTPNEPAFSTASIIERVAPVPLAAIHSTHDEYVPLAQFQQVFARAKDPKRAWVIEAADHRFSDNLTEFDRRLLEAISWIRASAPH